ncbi:MAG: ATP-dependent DNA helicase RecG [Chloroflexota bacterium]
MSSAFKKLSKILELEQRGNYKNKAVIGGIEKYIPVWIESARTEAQSESVLALVEQVADSLMGYGRLPGASARSQLISAILERIELAISQQETPAATPVKTPVVVDTTAVQESAVDDTMVQVEPEPIHQAIQDVVEDVSDEEIVSEEPVEIGEWPDELELPVDTVSGIGAQTATKLEKLGIRTVYDLLTHYPRDYVDYSKLKPINQLEPGDQVTIIGTVKETSVSSSRRGKRITRSLIGDGTASIECTWFNQPWIAEKLRARAAVMISGTVGQYLGRNTFQSPSWELVDGDRLHTGRIVPVYPLTAGISAKVLRSRMKKVVDQWAPQIPDPLPVATRRRHKLMGLVESLREVHFPSNERQLGRARQRIAFEEMLTLQLGLLRMRQQWRSAEGLALEIDQEWLDGFVSSLPFELTQAQQNALDDILKDMAEPVPMNRLLQGDVGCGKTLVAAIAAAIAARNGAQAAFMAPTEILAEQHAKSIRELLPEHKIVLLTGSLVGREREQIYQDITTGTAEIIIGTHALIQENVEFRNLALAIIDEQHRFGVEQRATLQHKGIHPHVLVMTATPIPRTLALSVYGDLDLTIIDEMPPGRKEIKTYWLESHSRQRAYDFITKQVREGYQAFIICPLVEDSADQEIKSATQEYERLSTSVFPDLRLGLMHGRLKSKEKDAAMIRFAEGEIDILVSTTVVEVGIDVPNATIMLIEGANRFGLAQLHQLRGRVGRGEAPSYCILLADRVTPEAKERLTVMTQTDDGFVLAEKDLHLRGPGEFLGTRQSGLPDLKMASVLDVELLEEAREEAQTLYQHDQWLQDPVHNLLSSQVDRFWHDVAGKN